MSKLYATPSKSDKTSENTSAVFKSSVLHVGSNSTPTQTYANKLDESTKSTLTILTDVSLLTSDSINSASVSSLSHTNVPTSSLSPGSFHGFLPPILTEQSTQEHLSASISGSSSPISTPVKPGLYSYAEYVGASGGKMGILVVPHRLTYLHTQVTVIVLRVLTSPRAAIF